MTAASEFDFVIVGAGTAGCIVAHRLAEQGHTVCVLEAGPKDTNPFIHVPAGIMKISTNRALTWPLECQPSANTDNRRIALIQGKVLGGGSSINGMIYNRGQPADFNLWERMGAEDWGYASVLPYFRRYETYLDGGDEAYRGRDGRVRVTSQSRPDPLCDAFIAGAREVGFPLNADYNGATQEGVGRAQATIHRGRRQSAARAYLVPARRRGVDVRTNAYVRRILLNEGRAIGVAYSNGLDGSAETVRARICTILSAGTVHTAKIMQLSGLGPGEVLRQHGLDVIRDLPVGQNLSDHYACRLVARVRSSYLTVNQLARGPRLVSQIGRWLLQKPSILSMSSMSLYAFGKANPLADETDYCVTFTPASLKAGLTRVLDDFPGVTSGGWRLRPDSRGYVRIASADFREAPLIQPNYLDTDSDRQGLIRAMKQCQAILRSNALKGIVEDLVMPAQDIHSDDEWLSYIRQYGSTAYHLVGSCTMGAPDDGNAVVDPRLRVKGIDGLRIVDASVMPTTPSGNSNAATAMIAERASDLLLADVKRTQQAVTGKASAA